jgi:prepilin-type N-terminal cleavage/methylation domain-containing protein
MAMRIKNNEKGFTLIEVMVSVAILGIVVITFLAFFTNGFKSIVTTGKRSQDLYQVQATIEGIQLNDPIGINQNLSYPHASDPSKNILISGKTFEININGTDKRVTVFLPNPNQTDTTAPSIPTNLTSIGTTTTSIELTWMASIDDIGVTDYEVFKDGVSVGTTVNTGYIVGGLSPSTSYSFTVKAKDAAGNISAASAALSATTN